MKYYPPKKTESLLPKNIPKYYGLLNNNSQDYFLKKALSSYKCQIQRCYYKSKKDYKYYGSKGIEVSYSKRDFVSWYLFNIKNFERKNKYLIIIFCEKSKDPIFIARNYKEVFNLTGIRESHINRYCNGEIKRSTKGYTLRYWSGNESELPYL